PGCKPGSTTETFVALRAQIDNWRWAGVPFYLRTGKRMPHRYSEIVVQFRDVPHDLFAAENSDVQANKLVIRLQPQEGIQLQMMYKVRGLGGGMKLQKAELNLSTEDFKPPRNAYERLLFDVVRGNQTLFVRRDEVEVAWSWVDDIMQAWQRETAAPKHYSAGTWGPTAAIALAERNGHSWHE
ncbi:MAG: glucose-6-phosphate dehydrogenase, partial [Litorivicinus sp.]